VSLAHNGVLFLDEMPEFGPAALQCLRQPLEDGAVTLVRAEGRVRFPSRFLLVGAANPCPCGFLGDADRACRCPPSVVERYTARVGGPLMDRIDLVVEVRRPSPDVLLRAHDARTSEELLARVMCARERSAARDGATPSALSGSHLLEACAMEADERRFVEKVARVKHLSARGVTRLLRVARTVADLAESSRVRVEDLSVASGFRQEPGA
jgi:magnesium chelatase family protein